MGIAEVKISTAREVIVVFGEMMVVVIIVVLWTIDATRESGSESGRKNETMEYGGLVEVVDLVVGRVDVVIAVVICAEAETVKRSKTMPTRNMILTNVEAIMLLGKRMDGTLIFPRH